MTQNLSPEIRRMILRYAAMENLSYEAAVECLICEGFKALAGQNARPFTPVDKKVDKHV